MGYSDGLAHVLGILTGKLSVYCIEKLGRPPNFGASQFTSSVKYVHCIS